MSDQAQAPDTGVARLLAKAEANLSVLRKQYQEGETMDIREKYLDEIRDEMDKADAIVWFIKANMKA